MKSDLYSFWQRADFVKHKTRNVQCSLWRLLSESLKDTDYYMWLMYTNYTQTYN